ncbi:MAG: histidine phosphatase family protein [Oscillospiraceae bacterium]|nr:histidine phosphatase family protein [Oscillospiraceae bacterium]
MNICIVRHGETDWNNMGKWQGREDIPLNIKGVYQAGKCGLALQKRKWSAVFSSPLSRAKQTADIIAHINEISPVREESGLIERDYGKASGLTPEERKKLFPDGKYESVGGVEDWETVKDRVYNAVLNCARKSDGGDIIIVSHGAAINSLLAHLSNHEIGSGKTILKNGCLNMLEYTNGVLKIVFYNKSADEVDL